MSDPDIISTVSQVFVKVLDDELASFSVALESPKMLKDSAEDRVSVVLYRVAENAMMKNQQPIRVDANEQQRPPLALDLHYLVTPLAGDVGKQHQMLSRVLAAFYDRSILEGTDFLSVPGGEALADLELRVILNPLSLEEMTRIWQALERFYELSVTYLVRVVPLDSNLRQSTTPVFQKRGNYAVAE